MISFSDRALRSKTLGLVGGGQLGKMLAIAAANLGIECVMLDPGETAVARYVARHIKAEFDDQDAIKELFTRSARVSFEFENVSVEALTRHGDLLKLAPAPEALFVANDRLREKEFFQQCGLAVAEFRAIPASELCDDAYLRAVILAGKQLGFPIIVKTCSLGYDGKGQCSLSSEVFDSQTRELLLKLKAANRLIVEKKIPFSREISVLAARSADGETVVYPCPVNEHRNGILFSSLALEAKPVPELEAAVKAVANKLDYTGVLAIEFFQVGNKYIANEMAPRVHNSGHWTIEGTVSSQFENHVRAVMKLPLGSTELRFPTAMFNIVGEVPDAAKVLKLPGVHLHLYGKEPRPGRKLGHLTIEADNEQKLRERMAAVCDICGFNS